MSFPQRHLILYIRRRKLLALLFLQNYSCLSPFSSLKGNLVYFHCFTGHSPSAQAIRRRKIRLKESNAKCCHLKNWPAGVYLSEAQKPIPRPPYTLCTCGQSTYPHRGQQFTKLGRKYQHDALYLQPINSDNSCRKVRLQIHFLDDDILLWCLYRHWLLFYTAFTMYYSLWPLRSLPPPPPHAGTPPAAPRPPPGARFMNQ
jgi:hypothetical protein